MSKKLYVGNLPYSMTDDGLKDLFSSHGNVTSARVVREKQTDRSKGFGFVEIEDDGQADSAVAELNGADVGGRKINVAEARPVTDSGPRNGGGGGGGRGRFHGQGGSGGGRSGGRGGDYR